MDYPPTKKYKYNITWALLQALAFLLFFVTHTQEQGAGYFLPLDIAIAQKTSFLRDIRTARTSNRELLLENEKLRNKVFFLEQMVTERQQVASKRHIAAKVIGNTYRRKNNKFIINKGLLDGVREGAGVITAGGIAGVVTEVKRKNAQVMSILNTLNSVSSSIKNKDDFGTLYWDGNDYRYMILEDLEWETVINPGDTVVTSPYSYEFPEGIPIGIVNEVNEKAQQHIRTAKVKLLNRMNTLSYVYVFKNPYQKEIESLLEQKKH